MLQLNNDKETKEQKRARLASVDSIVPKEDIDPKIDIAFKKIFGSDENKSLLISLINSIVSKEDKIQDITLKNPYNLQNYGNAKVSILDIKAVGKNGKYFNIEMQMASSTSYKQRALYYWAKLYSERLKKSDLYNKLNKTIGIHILNFTFAKDLKGYHNFFYIVDDGTKQRYFKDLELHVVELNKFIGSDILDSNYIVSKISNSLDMWSAFLSKYKFLKLSSLVDNNSLQEVDIDALSKASETLKTMSFSERERDIYEARLKHLRYQNTINAEHREEVKLLTRTIKEAEKKLEEAEKKLEEERKEIVYNAFKANLPDNMITLLVKKISLKEIAKLREQWEKDKTSTTALQSNVVSNSVSPSKNMKTDLQHNTSAKALGDTPSNHQQNTTRIKRDRENNGENNGENTSLSR